MRIKKIRESQEYVWPTKTCPHAGARQLVANAKKETGIQEFEDGKFSHLFKRRDFLDVLMGKIPPTGARQAAVKQFRMFLKDISRRNKMILIPLILGMSLSKG